MITNFKIFESLNRKLKIGDYVILSDEFENSYTGLRINKYEIGQLYKRNSLYWFNFNGKKTNLKLEDIMYWSENKEEIEAIIAQEKYNI